ncbi:MAG: mandelate racemase/muconate lactonizing protein [Planctomycetota bacterium]|nr:mandelate racemase/muconate lactonizing protein [Planctomycetota bacterium]
MKITAIETIQVRVPLKPNRNTLTAHGVHITSDYVIIKVHTDSGIIGLGEATVAPRWSGETPGSCIWAIREILAPKLVGLDPTCINQARLLMDRALKLNPFTKAAVEMALWDISGKAAGVPVYVLLGGKVRNIIPTKMVIGAFGLDQVKSLTEEFVAMGIKTIKVKTGIELEADVARVKAVREAAGPDIGITIDSNCGWSPATARVALKRLKPLNILIAEQPIAPGDNAAMARLRQASGIPIMADESAFTLADTWNLIRDGAVDVISIYPGKNGGIANSIEIANAARSAGVSCHIGSNLELGIGTAAMIHLAASVASIDSEKYPSDILGPHYHVADLLKTPLSLGIEGALVPTGPGLGVELDEVQLQEFRVDGRI